MAFTDLERKIEDHTIVIGREIVAKPLRHGRRRRFFAEFPRKGYRGIGLSREEALGKLLLHTPTPFYLNITLEVS